MKCPEQFRLTNLHPDDHEWVQRGESDAALVGTTFHEVVHKDLSSGGDFFDTPGEAVSYGKTFYRAQVRDFQLIGRNFSTESFRSEKAALQKMEDGVDRWWRSQERDYWLHVINEHPGMVRFEQTFEVPFLSGLSHPLFDKVGLTGTPDVIDGYGNRILDWKTGSRKYQRWEKQRWDVQSNVYTFAAAALGLITPDADGRYEFTFKVFIHGETGEPQTVTVYRSQNQWAWLTELVTNIVEQMEAPSRRWPLRDDHALCGPKWCPAWKSCKGKYVDDDWT